MSRYALPDAFECIPCAEGCEACVDGSPCVAALNWVVRTTIFVLACLVICCLPFIVHFTIKYGHVRCHTVVNLIAARKRTSTTGATHSLKIGAWNNTVAFRPVSESSGGPLPLHHPTTFLHQPPCVFHSPLRPLSHILFSRSSCCESRSVEGHSARSSSHLLYHSRDVQPSDCLHLHSQGLAEGSRLLSHLWRPDAQNLADTQNEICLRNSYFEKPKRVSAEKSQKAKMDEIQSMSGSFSNMSQKQIAAKVQVKYPSLLLTKNKEGPFPTASRQGSKIKGDSRHLSQEWFYKEMPSGEKILRSWMEVLLNHSKASVKRLSTTRWSAHYGAVKVLAENFDGIISAIEELCDQEVNLETREALRLFIGEKRLHLAEEAIDFAVQKSEQYNISMERRIRRKKRMPGELASSTDAGLTLRAELQKDMLECLDRLNIELEKRVKSIKDVASLFEVVQSKTLLSADTEQLKFTISKFTNFYDEVSETELLLEIPRLRRHLKAANITVSNWVTLDYLKFIVEWDFTASLPNLTVALKLFITICASIASSKAVKISDMYLLRRIGIIVGVACVLLAIRTLAAPPAVIVGRTKEDLKAYLCNTDWWDHSFTTCPAEEVAELRLLFIESGLCLSLTYAGASKSRYTSRLNSFSISLSRSGREEDCSSL
ncbi:hypothetical protein EVAR_10592_1 [Eumeta japonica]|uniref:Uncharacterized protein n=1 Tax=Eumeta variegata TaxID=151549 RepID=A0A4C1U215_EUMVA|nr:hypothetical protein EVAR_10592_1 [Eumeta japonica]